MAKKFSVSDFTETSDWGSSATYIEDLYEQYLQDPEAVDSQWRQYFSAHIAESESPHHVSHKEMCQRMGVAMRRRRSVAHAPAVAPNDTQQTAVDALIQAYRAYGHCHAAVNPLSAPDPLCPLLTLAHHGLSEECLDQTVLTRGVMRSAQASLREVLDQLQATYCGSIGFDYSLSAPEDELTWLQETIEWGYPEQSFSQQERLNILEQLVAAEGLEKFLNIKYPGQKRFSIEGGDSLIPLLDDLVKSSRAQGINELVMGMAHRGRLNVLLNIMGQSPAELFLEFEGIKDFGLTSGDVKYHSGYSRDLKTPDGPLHLALGFNPSHLEFINPVVMGSVRARQTMNHGRRDHAMVVMIHGDAAFIGEGIVMETLSMSQTRAYHVGGAFHVILNNQVGFTTSMPEDARSSRYCSDLAKMLHAPVFHVNGDDPEAVIYVTRLALAYRMRFHKDVFIDLVCYRRHGHQEVDEPRATQPKMYQVIQSHPTPCDLYGQQLMVEKVCAENALEEMRAIYRRRLEQGRQVVETLPSGLGKHYASNWTQYIGHKWRTQADTQVSRKVLDRLGTMLTDVPADFVLQHQVKKLMAGRQAMAAGEQPLDWGYAEMMAYATLLDQEFPIRMSGEDIRRGTFFHRHAVVHDQETGRVWAPLEQIASAPESVQMFDSLLAEGGPMGFEYGYSTASPDSLVLWEAQFGDFANTGQVIIDQFISSGWQKWNRLSGLVLLLPHGYEGMGPEHSSARLERYLQLCAQDNIQVCVPTTPAQIFHLLRRQVLRPWRKPLVVITPKSLLRHKLAVSSLEELTRGQLQLVIDEVDDIQPAEVTRLILCSGKVFYDLLARRRLEELSHIAIVRIEQLYPFPYDEVDEIVARYPNAQEVVWAQEEPKNQGAWFCSRHRFQQSLNETQTLSYAGRDPSAAPAVGYVSLHKAQQEALICQALGLSNEGGKTP